MTTHQVADHNYSSLHGNCSTAVSDTKCSRLRSACDCLMHIESACVRYKLRRRGATPTDEFISYLWTTKRSHTYTSSACVAGRDLKGTPLKRNVPRDNLRSPYPKESQVEQVINSSSAHNTLVKFCGGSVTHSVVTTVTHTVSHSQVRLFMYDMDACVFIRSASERMQPSLGPAVSPYTYCEAVLHSEVSGIISPGPVRGLPRHPASDRA